MAILIISMSGVGEAVAPAFSLVWISIASIQQGAELRSTTPTAGFNLAEGKMNISNSTIPQNF
jgi:hypothetical protein